MREGMELGADDYVTKPLTSGELLGAIRSRLERQARFQQVSSQALDEKRREIIQVLSLELRTSFISLITMQELISRQMGQLSPAELDNILNVLRLGSQHLRHVVEQLVFAAQLEMGTLDETEIQQHGQPANLSQLVERAANLARGFTQRNHDAFIHLDQLDRAAQVLCNIDGLRYSIAEMIACALNALLECNELTISQWQAQGFAWIRITFQSDPTALNVFDPIMETASRASGNEPAPRKHSALGMGLPVAKAIIELHGGALELSAAGETQSALTIRLPLLHDPD